MRPIRLALLSIPLLVTSAAARPSGGGGGGGGGALSKVSSGIGNASRGGSSQTPSGSGNERTRSTEHIAEVCYDGTGRVIDQHDTDECYRPKVHHDGNLIYVRRPVRHEPVAPRAKVDLYVGAQKVADSDGSASVELAVTDDRFRIAGTFSRYFERVEGQEGLLTMTMPTLMGGVRIDDRGPTAVHLEGGVVLVRTNGDVMGDTKLTGGIAGARVEHTLAPKISVLGDVQQMWFDNEIRATAGRVGVRYKYVQASFRVLDFNVGPPLYGPEVGVRF